ncbi:L-serine ammonia-lyase [Candidatus Moduliflexus flocculans]|uniref:L-serine dehydratase n=1 Tax=Candidatus Moduliflexus flocculans TaxID=1499966 RepID=A0A0S6W441_9BACT|nr:L-serine ammonia-lyase [Candidatus Moduliflexus flocculans]
MESLRELYRIGMGPSSSHTMAPRRAAALFAERAGQAASYRVTLYGSLAATGRGHLTHEAITQPFSPKSVVIIERPDITRPFHPNGMLFEALDTAGAVLTTWEVYSIGGGALREDGQQPPPSAYDISTMTGLLEWTTQTGNPLWMYVKEREGEDIWEYLTTISQAMNDAIERGLQAEGVLPGGLKLSRKAYRVYQQTFHLNTLTQRTGLLTAYALAVSEENAAGGMVVTAPTCGSCGVLPSVLRYLQQRDKFAPAMILRALATAGLVGNIVKTNASISGAAVGCQGEVGTACAMAAAAAAQLLGATPHQIEYAAEIALEHMLGLTCDPIAGLVQVPCIERNAMAAMRALDCAEYVLLSDGRHLVPFDRIIETMKHTGHDLPSLYRETSAGGLAVYGGL